MESRLKMLGHPLHPMLVVFPVGLLVAAVIFDVADAVGGPGFLGEVAYWNIVAGLVGGVLAAVAGAVDLLAIPTGTRAKRVAATHALVNLGVILLFAGVWAVRMGAERRGAGGGLLAIELVALGGLALGVWFGGELVDRLGVGVDAEAGLDAPSSLRARRGVPGEGQAGPPGRTSRMDRSGARRPGGGDRPEGVDRAGGVEGAVR